MAGQDPVVVRAGVVEQDPVVVSAGVVERDRVLESGGVAQQDPAVLGPEVQKELHRENG